LRIAIVNDMALAIEALRRLVSSVPGHQVAWTARDGQTAIERCAADRPDLVLMDLFMPRMSGVECTRRIMAATPCPILIVTSTVEASYAEVYDAMGHGALDAADTPVLGLSGNLAGGAPLLAKIAIIGKLVGARAVPAPRSQRPTRPPAPGGTSLVAIGASTGGPAALAEVLTALGPRFLGAVLIVQHVDEHFAPGLASWLADHSRFPVELAREGSRPRPGVALLAATGDHLVMQPDGSVAYTRKPVELAYRPSVDVLFQSLVAHGPRHGVAALLTGMGKDGAAGLLALRKRGWTTFAQDEASSVVYGMPRAAAELGAAERVLPVSAMGAEILRKLAG
jgi:two-component system response regulator WspF